MEGECRNC